MALKKFNYVATDKAGQQVAGSYRAENREQVADYLRGREMFVVSIKQDLGFSMESLKEIQIGGLGLKDRMLLVKQLSTMMGAGLPLVQTLEILAKQQENKKLQTQLELVLADVEGGATLSAAFKKNTKIFNEIQINLISAGEKSGNMVEVIAQVAEDLEKSAELVSKIRGAMIYPAIIFVTIIIVLVILVTFMIPTVKDLYKDFNAEDQIPGITKFLVAVSDFVTNPIGLAALFIIIGVSYASFRSYRSTERGNYAIGQAMLKMPVFGKLLEKIELAQFGRLLSMLLKSGVSIIDALKIVSEAMGNPVYRRAVAGTIDEVSKGVPLAVPLAKSNVFPLIYTRMVSTGEQTGNLDKVLADMGRYYEAEVNDMTNNLTKLMEPLILLIVGGLVAFLAVAVYLPIYQIGNVIV